MWLKKKKKKDLKRWHVELAEWLVHWAAKLVSRGLIFNQVIFHDAYAMLIYKLKLQLCGKKKM